MPLESPVEERSERVTVRCSPELKDRYQDALDAEGKSMSEDLREHLEAVAGRERAADGGQDLPPLLADGLRALRRATDHAGRVPATVAKSRVAEATRVREPDVIRCVIRPLDELGYLDVPKMGVLEISEKS